MTDRSVDDPPSRSALSTGGGEVTATVVVIDGGENAVAQADSIVEATIVMANPGLNRMDLTRGAETSDIVRRIHIFSERCSGFEVRWVLGPDDAADLPATVRVSAATICSVEYGLRFIANLPFLTGKLPPTH